MPKTRLIYFGDSNDSKYGTLRGAAAFAPIFLIMFSASYFQCTSPISTSTRILAVGLASLFLCSAVGVQLPSSYREAALYGGLVGLVVSSCCLCFMSVSTGSAAAYIVAVPLLTLSVSLVSILTMMISKRFGFYA
jgi:hypothetical protein